MAVNVNIDLKHTKNTLKFINGPGLTKELMQVAILTKGHLVKNWLKARGGDEKRMKKLQSEAYIDRKKKSGRKPIPDLNFTGKLQQSLTPAKVNKKTTMVTFSQAEMGKARGNYDRRPNMMKLSQKWKTKMVNYVNNIMKKL